MGNFCEIRIIIGKKAKVVLYNSCGEFLFTSESTKPIFKLKVHETKSGNMLARVQWGREPADLWGITFCIHGFWGFIVLCAPAESYSKKLKGTMNSWTQNWPTKVRILWSYFSTNEPLISWTLFSHFLTGHTAHQLKNKAKKCSTG